MSVRACCVFIVDIKGLTNQISGKNQTDGIIVRPSVASSDHAPHSNAPLTPQTIKAIQSVLQGLQLGKVFDVIITRIEGNTVSLQIPGSPLDSPILQAELKSPPPLGTRLTLQLNDDIPKPELKVIARPNSPQDVVSQNLRTSLQTQKSIPPLLANLAHLANKTDQVPKDFPAVVTETARHVVQQLPDRAAINTPEKLKQVMQQSGPYLESQLAKQSIPDVKKLPLPLPEIYTQAASNTASTQNGRNKLASASAEIKQLRFEMANQTLQVMSRAIQQQPLQDIRANLLRLATVIRASSDLYRLQKDAFQNMEGQQDGIKGKPTDRPIPTPLPDALLNNKPMPPAKPANASASTTAYQTTGNKPTTGDALGMQANPVVRSQMPQVQTAAQASIASMLNSESILDELLGQIESALTRIQVQQLQTAATEQHNRPVWVMELPVKTDQGIDLFDLRVQRDKENHTGDETNAPWTVKLAFNLDKLGAIHAHISLFGEDKISTTFWAEQAETSTYFNQHLDKLALRFKHVGLDVTKLDCRCGKPDSPPPSAEPRLVDEKV